MTLWSIYEPIKSAMLILVRLYQILISPIFPKTCRFYPTCSRFMILAIREWGIFKGVFLGICRICRCRPKGKSGEDFVPLNIKGGLKWTY